MFFKNFPKRKYYGEETVDILSAFKMIHNVVDRAYAIQKYTISDFETPEIVSYKLYKNTSFGWVILLLNNIVDPFVEWTMDPTTLEDYTKKKYGSLTDVLYHRNIESNEAVDEVFEELYSVPNALLPYNIIPVSCIRHEQERNDRSRFIEVIAPKFINKVADEFVKLFEEQYN